MALDSFVQLQPDSSGKQVDFETVQTGAGTTIYRQRAVIMGSVEDGIAQLLTINRQQLAVLRALLALFSNEVGVAPTEEDFITKY